VARKARDYAAEERRRNERARERGFTSRAQARRVDVYTRAGFRSEDDYKAAIREARRWSKTHTQKDTSRYPAGGSVEQHAAYYKAFVVPRRRLAKLKHMRRYLVPRFMSDAEFDELYL
jgi:hypothetical protein